MKFILASVIVSLLFTGCGVLRPGIRGSGVVQSQTRGVENFTEVELSGFGSVNIFVGEEPSVTVTTDDNLLDLVDTYVLNGKLIIKPTGRIHPVEGLQVDVSVPELVAAGVSGAGDINVHGMQGESLDLSISGAGTLTADGEVGQITTAISGAGDADLKSLMARRAEIQISGAGSALVYATESVNARVSGAGSVVCYGNPNEVTQRVSGVGSVTTVNEIRDSGVGMKLSDQ